MPFWERRRRWSGWCLSLCRVFILEWKCILELNWMFFFRSYFSMSHNFGPAKIGRGRQHHERRWDCSVALIISQYRTAGTFFWRNAKLNVSVIANWHMVRWCFKLARIGRFVHNSSKCRVNLNLGAASYLVWHLGKCEKILRVIIHQKCYLYILQKLTSTRF